MRLVFVMFPFRVDPFLERSKHNFESVVSLERGSLRLKKEKVKGSEGEDAQVGRDLHYRANAQVGLNRHC